MITISPHKQSSAQCTDVDTALSALKEIKDCRSAIAICDSDKEMLDFNVAVTIAAQNATATAIRFGAAVEFWSIAGVYSAGPTAWKLLMGLVAKDPLAEAAQAQAAMRAMGMRGPPGPGNGGRR